MYGIRILFSYQDWSERDAQLGIQDRVQDEVAHQRIESCGMCVSRLAAFYAPLLIDKELEESSPARSTIREWSSSSWLPAWSGRDLQGCPACQPWCRGVCRRTTIQSRTRAWPQGRGCSRRIRRAVACRMACRAFGAQTFFCAHRSDR